MSGGLAGRILRYRAMAYSVGIGLIVLVFIGMPLKYLADFHAVVAVVGPIHGFLYIVYLVTVLDLARTRRVGILQLLAMVGAGLLPFLAFYVERRVTGRIEATLPQGTESGLAPPN
jgi:integral membrane protein